MRPNGVYDWASEREIECHDVLGCARVTNQLRLNEVYDCASERELVCRAVGAVLALQR